MATELVINIRVCILGAVITSAGTCVDCCTTVASRSSQFGVRDRASVDRPCCNHWHIYAVTFSAAALCRNSVVCRYAIRDAAYNIILQLVKHSFRHCNFALDLALLCVLCCSHCIVAKCIQYALCSTVQLQQRFKG